MELDDLVNKKFARAAKGSSKPKPITRKDNNPTVPLKNPKRIIQDPQEHIQSEEAKAIPKGEQGGDVTKVRSSDKRKKVKLGENPLAPEEVGHGVQGVLDQREVCDKAPLTVEEKKGVPATMNVRPVKLKNKLKMSEITSEYTEDVKPAIKPTLSKVSQNRIFGEKFKNEEEGIAKRAKPDPSKLKFVRKKKDYKYKEPAIDLSNTKPANTSESFPLKPAIYEKQTKSSKKKKEELEQAIIKAQNTEKNEEDEYKDDFEEVIDEIKTAIDDENIKAKQYADSRKGKVIKLNDRSN